MSAHIKLHEIHVSSLLRIPQTDPTDAVPFVVRSVLLWTFSGRSALEPKQILKGYCSSLCFCMYGNPLELGQVRIDWLKHKRVCMCVYAYNRYIHTTGLKLRNLQKTTLLPFFPRSFPPASLSRLSRALFFASLSSHLGFSSISP